MQSIKSILPLDLPYRTVPNNFLHGTVRAFLLNGIHRNGTFQKKVRMTPYFYQIKIRPL